MMFIFLMQALLNFGINEVIKAWNLRDIMQQQMMNILDNLEEAIITKNQSRIDLCNDKGGRILWSISQHFNLSSGVKTQKEEEQLILKAKIFKLFEDENELGKRANTKSSIDVRIPIVEEFKSINQLLRMKNEDLSQKIFTIDIKKEG